MIALPTLAALAPVPLMLAQLASPAPVLAPPQDWTSVRPLPHVREADGDANLSAFVRAEVKAGHCAAATLSPQGWSLRVDLIVYLAASGLPRRVVPRAIACPSVEQYAAGLVSSKVRGSMGAAPPDTEGWYRTSLTFTWPA